MSSVGHRIGGNQPKQGDYGFLRPAAKPAMQIFKEPKELTMKDMEFLNRMDNDTEDRRRTAFITQLKKDPRFRPSMLEPPKPKFQTVSLTEGPIIKTVKMTQTGPKKKPHKWGPLGGWF